MSSSTDAALERPFSFASPDGRLWERDVDHQSGPRTRLAHQMFERGFGSGLATAFERLGAPLARAEACHVHGWCYLRMVPAGAPDKPGAGAAPPDLVLKVLSRLHPELRRREKNARRALETELWMDDVDAWWEERPTWEETFRHHQRLDLAGLDDQALADAIAAALRDSEAMLTRHFELVTPGAGIGLAITEGAAHGLAAHEVADALRGSSAATAAPTHLRDTIAAALERHGVGPGATLAELRGTSEEIHGLIDEYLDTYGWRVMGDDLNAPTLCESPELVARSLTGPAARREVAEPTSFADLLTRVPAAGRPRLEHLLRNAGRAYEMLDDNSAVARRGFGTARRVVLEGARRLVASGRIESADHVWMLDAAELNAVLRGASAPDRVEITARHDEFVAAHAADAPLHLGGEPSPPPDPGLFPRGLATIAEAVGTYLAVRFPPPGERAETGRVDIDGRAVATGHGIGGAKATGRAVVAMTVDDAFERLEPGDVLVCPCTNPAYNVVFPMASAVVTAVGGPLGHTAVTAREVGIPAVVGIGDLSVIADGAMVTVTS